MSRYLDRYRDFNASLAQLVEQFIRNEQVGGSSPLRGSRNLYYCYIKEVKHEQLF
jgi:hypothetical protein